MALDNVIRFNDIPVYQKNNLVLNHVSFDINKGEFVYLIGKTGSGKTSLLKTIYADLPVLEGSAVVCDFDLKKIKKKDIPFLRRKLGIIFQDFQLLTDRTVHDNLVFVMKATGWKDKNSMEDRIHDVLIKVNLENKGKKMPHQLSGGEQQRVGIARALVNDPEVILADEPTGNLDPDTSKGIVRLLMDIKDSGRSVIMATHNYNLIHYFPSRIIKCENGKTIDSGNETN